ERLMWLIIALLGAICTSLTTIFAKIGIKNVNSNFATAFRTLIVICFSLLLCFISGSIYSISSLDIYNYIFLVLSGIATGCSWLCYYKALKLGEVSKVASIDKSSFVLTNVLFLIFFFSDTTKGGNILVIVMLLISMGLMLSGTLLMISKEKNVTTSSRKWIIYAILSSVFASLVSLFVKIGLKGIPSDLGTLLRTIVVFVFALAIVLVKKDYKDAKRIDAKSWIFLTLSGISTGGAWLLEYSALSMEGVNPVAVSSLGKLSILLTIAISFIAFKEKINKKSFIGLMLITAGIILVVVFSL
ncbi:MAG: EamA family transporter, partial [Bacilli bacterium]